MIQQKQKYFIKANKILKYLITDDDETDTLITCKSSEIDLVTSDYDVYQALTSIKEYDDFNLNKLKKLFEVIEIVSYAQNMKKQKPILKDEDVKRLRKLVLGVKENDK